MREETSPKIKLCSHVVPRLLIVQHPDGALAHRQVVRCAGDRDGCLRSAILGSAFHGDTLCNVGVE